MPVASNVKGVTDVKGVTVASAADVSAKYCPATQAAASKVAVFPVNDFNTTHTGADSIITWYCRTV
jgi:hypothetical protein